jgi:hypothetical protein|eukprot:Stramenopile-MAST_4_protein_5413
MPWHDGGAREKRGGPRDAHDLSKEKRKQFYKQAKVISGYRKIVKQVEKERFGNAVGSVLEEAVNHSTRRYHRPKEGGTSAEDSTVVEKRFRPKTHRTTGKKRPNPFKKELTKQEERAAEHQRQIEEREEKSQKVKQSLKRRKVESKKMRQRTKYGQPVMKNALAALLEKIQRDA